MLHVRLNLITADPRLLSDSLKFIENEVRPEVESQPGSLGLILQANPELGIAVLQLFWASGDALRASEREAGARSGRGGPPGCRDGDRRAVQRSGVRARGADAHRRRSPADPDGRGAVGGRGRGGHVRGYHRAAAG